MGRHPARRTVHPFGRQAKAFINGTDRCAHRTVPISGTCALHLAKTKVKGSCGRFPQKPARSEKASCNVPDNANAIGPLSKSFSRAIFPVIGNTPHSWSKTRLWCSRSFPGKTWSCMFLTPGVGKRTKLKWKLDESSRKRSKTPNQGCFMAKSTAIAKTHPLGTIDSDYLKSSIYENCKMVYEDG